MKKHMWPEPDILQHLAKRDRLSAFAYELKGIASWTPLPRVVICMVQSRASQLFSLKTSIHSPKFYAGLGTLACKTNTEVKHLRIRNQKEAYLKTILCDT